MDLKSVIIVSLLNGFIVSILLRNFTDFNEFQVLLSSVLSWTLIYFTHFIIQNRRKEKEKQQELIKIKIENQYKAESKKNEERKENRIKLQKDLDTRNFIHVSQKNIIGIQLEKDS